MAPLGARAAVTESGRSSVIRAMQALVTVLTVMLVVVACLGVFNTVVLDTATGSVTWASARRWA
ncbi:hypothetical protein ACFXGT_34855 [Streptomyces sp. NPDC059352]|uniref:hypothetical protein n=1 Tax=Streptomyces sp. NPDC059352 TaxID=3346810 RepID=UPI0036AF1FCB